MEESVARRISPSLLGGLGLTALLTFSIVLTSRDVPSRLGVPQYWPWLLTGLQVLSLWAAGAGHRWAGLSEQLSSTMDRLLGPHRAARLRPGLRHLGGSPDLELLGAITNRSTIMREAPQTFPPTGLPGSDLTW